MKNIFKSKLATALILTVTVILAGIAIFTAVRLYQLGNQPVAPNVPSSIPHAQEVTTPNPNCVLSFTLNATPTTTPTATPTPTPTPVPQCNNACTTGANCPSGLSCSSGFCRNPSCSDQTSCICPTPTPTPTPTATPTGAPNSCNGTCGSNSNCQSNYICFQGFCRNPSCTDSQSCACAPTSPPVSSPTPPALPSSGTDWPTFVGAGIGIFVILGSLLLVF